VTKELAVASRQRTLSNCLFHQGIFDQKKKHDCHPTPTLLFSIFPIEDKLKSRHFDTTEMIRGRIAGGSVLSHRTRLPS
jgi:hypothetical protein